MITILGGGPAGASAAIAARLAGAEVLVVEKSRFPRHKVCGEFLSPEAVPLLSSVGVHLSDCAKISRINMRFARAERSFSLPEPAIGLSRYSLDALLLSRAQALGAAVAQEGPPPVVVAHGRRASAAKGNRLFGFKAHFTGVTHDMCELFFFHGGYVGVSPVENGLTNVCGILPERFLKAHSFEIDSAVAQFAPLRERIDPLERVMDWLTVGPLVFEQKTTSATREYLAGDALSFVDPFTGSGMLCAIVSGLMAGEAAANATPVDEYVARCRTAFSRAFEVSSLFRRALAGGWAEYLAPFVPRTVLYRLTRPAIVSH